MSTTTSLMQRLRSSPAVICCLLIVVAISLASIRIRQWLANPKVYLLVGETEARWIRSPSPFNLSTHSYYRPMRTLFRCNFELTESVPQAQLTVQAFRQCQVWLDADPQSSAPLFSSPEKLSLWKTRHQVPLPEPLERGSHQLQIAVSNQAAHPCLLVASPELGISSGLQWEVQESDGTWAPAVFANDTISNVPQQVNDAGYPSVQTAFSRIWPYLVLILALSFTWNWWSSGTSSLSSPAWYWGLTPARLRWILLAGWLVMAINNFLRVPLGTGFDVRDHLAYVKFIVDRQSLPFANDGWQMFQSPLSYLLAAPFYALLSSIFGPESCEKFLRLLPLLCGMAQIEIVYRTARAVFPQRDDLQMIATTVGGLLPMNLYMSQSFGNEPLSGCLTAWAVLCCVRLLSDPARATTSRFYWMLGAIWGLALLAKVTPLLLAPLILVVVFGSTPIGQASLWRRMHRAWTTCLACFLVAGWYYLRNWFYLGTPFVGGWDPSRGAEYQWWQDPSYRNWSQLSSFGSALQQPVYSGVLSFWDAMYSSMWTDAHLSGTLMPVNQVPWNVDWMEVGAWLSLLPMCCMLAGVVRLWTKDLSAARSSLLFALVACGIYFAAIIDLYVHVPVYSAAKASYALGLLPCFAILVAAGSGPCLRFRWLRATFFALLTTWASAAYVAYFCLV